MSSVYIVVGTEDSDVKYCEAYAGVQSALGRAIQISSDFAGRGRIDLIDTSPEEEILLDGCIKWTFMDTNKHSVVVIFRRIAEAMLSQKDPSSAQGLTSNVVAPLDQPKVIPYDMEDKTLPAGWFYDGRPALMSDMQTSPWDVKDPVSDLTDNQKWALVIARVKKSPGYRQIPKGYSGFTADQAFALKELEGRTQTGQQILDAEIEMLQVLRANYTDQ
jgi:hypothetical protein